MARFDIINMLVTLEDLIAISSRLIEDMPLGAERVGTVASRSVAALSGFLTALTGLIAVSEELIHSSLNSGKPGSIRVFSGHFKQLLLIHRFSTRLGGVSFAAQLSALTEDIYRIFANVTDKLTGAAGISDEHAQHLVSVLYDIVADIGWSDLAARLFEHVRRKALT